MPALSRRQVLRTGAVGAATTSLAGPAAAVASAPSATPATVPTATRARSPLARSRFVAQQGSTFTMKSPVTSWQVRLDRVDDLFPVIEPADEERFSLKFSSSQPGPPQGTFTFARAGFEPTPLFVIPDENRLAYLAIINRL